MSFVGVHYAEIMKVKIIFFIFLLSVTISAQTKSSDAKLSRELIGLWHASPYVAAGMNDLYRFYPNGRFVFEYNQMVWSKRMISYSGKWRVHKEKLILTITKETVVVGGRRIKSEMSADGYEIQDGKEVTRILKPVKVEIKILGKLRQGELTKFISIGTRKYWRLSKNPKNYGD